MDPLPILMQCKLFVDLPEDTLRQIILPQGEMREFKKQRTIFEPQDQVDSLGVILDGSVKIMQLFSDGSNSLMSMLRSGYVLGLDQICTKSRRPPYYAIAGADVKILFFRAELFLKPGSLPEPKRLMVLQRLMTLLSHENMRKHYRLAVLSKRGLRDRILTYLTMQANRRKSNTFRIPFSREELAEYLCVNRSALSHELSQMEQEGLIRFHKNEFTLLMAGTERSLWI